MQIEPVPGRGGVDQRHGQLASVPIVLQAVKDYRKALYDLKTNPNYSPSLQVKADVERFFRSEWYNALTSVSGEFLLKKLKTEVM